MSYEKFLNLIDKTPIGATIDNKLGIIEKTDPDRIYIENIRAFYNLPLFLAKNLCEMAVRQGIFKKKIGIICPNEGCKRIIKSYNPEDNIDEVVTCLNCELREEEVYSFCNKELEKEIYYQLQDK
jgi:hypothetical protein